MSLGAPHHPVPCAQVPSPPPPPWGCCSHFLAVTAFCRFQSLSVPSSEAVSKADWL